MSKRVVVLDVEDGVHLFVSIQGTATDVEILVYSMQDTALSPASYVHSFVHSTVIRRSKNILIEL